MTAKGDAVATYLKKMKGQMVRCVFVDHQMKPLQGELLAFDDEALFVSDGPRTVLIMRHAMAQIWPASDGAIEVAAVAYKAD